MTENQKEIVLNNEKLVHYVLKNKMYIYPNNNNHRYLREYEDYYQEGMCALCEAVLKFDESKGSSFSTYAIIYIDGKLRTYKRYKDIRIKYSRSGYELNTELNRAMNELEIDLNSLSSYDIDNLMNYLGYDNEDEIQRYKIYKTLTMNNIVGIESPVSNTEDSLIIEDTIKDIKNDMDISDVEFNIIIDNIMNKLKSKRLSGFELYEEYIYTLLYGEEKLSQKYYSDKYNLSQSYVSRIIVKFNNLLIEYLKE